MPPMISQHGNHEIACPIRHQVLIRELGNASYIDRYLGNDDVVDVVSARGDGCDAVQSRETGMLATLIQRHLIAQPSLTA